MRREPRSFRVLHPCESPWMHISSPSLICAYSVLLFSYRGRLERRDRVACPPDDTKWQRVARCPGVSIYQEGGKGEVWVSMQRREMSIDYGWVRDPPTPLVTRARCDCWNQYIRLFFPLSLFYFCWFFISCGSSDRGNKYTFPVCPDLCRLTPYMKFSLLPAAQRCRWFDWWSLENRNKKTSCSPAILWFLPRRLGVWLGCIAILKNWEKHALKKMTLGKLDASQKADRALPPSR